MKKQYSQTAFYRLFWKFIYRRTNKHLKLWPVINRISSGLSNTNIPMHPDDISLISWIIWNSSFINKLKNRTTHTTSYRRRFLTCNALPPAPFLFPHVARRRILGLHEKKTLLRRVVAKWKPVSLIFTKNDVSSHLNTFIRSNFVK